MTPRQGYINIQVERQAKAGYVFILGKNQAKVRFSIRIASGHLYLGGVSDGTLIVKDMYYAYYGLFWMRSPYLDLWWRSCSTGTILERLITSIVRHKNKNRWVGDPLWRSFSLFCAVIFHESLRKTNHMISTRDPTFTCSCYIMPYYWCYK